MKTEIADATTRTHILLAAGCGGAVGAGLFWLLSHNILPASKPTQESLESATSIQLPAEQRAGDSDDFVVDEDTHQTTFAAMQKRLQELETKLGVTNEQLQRLSSELQRLDVQSTVISDSDINTKDLAPESIDQEAANTQIAGHTRQRFRTGRRLTREQRLHNLQTAGLDQQSADALLARQDEQRLAELELFDRAAREAWLDSDQFQTALEDLQAQTPDLRDELGTDAYDRYLFASGQSNRVRVSEVISGSAAEINGIQTDDVIIIYAQNRIFTLDELQQATRDGNRGEPVTVVVQRDQELLELIVERGPLGVQLTRDSLAPDS